MSNSDNVELSELLRKAANGEPVPWDEISEQHRGRLTRLISLRMDRRMQARVDASDVVQDALLEAYDKLDRYLAEPKMPFYLWLRSIAKHKLMALHRFHLGTALRDAKMEVAIDKGGDFDATSSAIGLAQIAASQLHPSEEVMRAEFQGLLAQKLDEMEPIDREIIVLRHFEQLSNAEAAKLLELDVSTASKRYIRALKRFQQAMQAARSASSGLVE